jgi:transcriptional regulator with XRE-family HTH domain
MRLANIVGIHPVYITQMCRGRRIPSIDLAYRLSRGLGISLDELVGSPKAFSHRHDPRKILAKLLKKEQKKNSNKPLDNN